jgi:hypothetical protein
VMVPPNSIGANQWRNFFTPSPIDRGQPWVFKPGRKTNVFTARFNSGNLVWNLQGSTATASASSTRCTS